MYSSQRNISPSSPFKFEHPVIVMTPAGDASPTSNFPNNSFSTVAASQEPSLQTKYYSTASENVKNIGTVLELRKKATFRTPLERSWKTEYNGVLRTEIGPMVL